MTPLKPVRADYEPAYPRRLTPEQVQQLLRPGLFARFAPATLVAGAVIAGTLAGGCDGGGGGPSSATGRPGGGGGGAGGGAGRAAALPALPARSTRADLNLQARVDQLIAELLGKQKKGYWNDRASVRGTGELSANPPVKYPSIPISYGNSYCGVFDVEAAREGTRALFAAYGLELRRGVRLKGDGFEFVADGYDERRGVGFKLVGGDPGRARFADQTVVPPTPEQALTKDELPAVDRAVAAGELRVFVANADGFPNMDGDLYTPMQYYLASVVDYLNWVHGDRQIAADEVLGKVPPGQREAEQRRQVLEQYRRRQQEEQAGPGNGQPAR